MSCSENKSTENEGDTTYLTRSKILEYLENRFITNSPTCCKLTGAQHDGEIMSRCCNQICEF